MFIKAGWFPLIVKRDDWTRYIEALEKADDNDLRPLVSLFVEAQRNALLQATEVAYEGKPNASVDEAIAAARDRLLQRGRISQKEWLDAKETADKLAESAQQRLEKIAADLTEEIGRLRAGFWFGAIRGGAGARICGAMLADHVADSEYEISVRLDLITDRRDSLVFSFYAVGPRYRGIIGVVAYLHLQNAEPALIKGGTFQINYEEDLASAQARFSPWLERVIVEGLTEWRRSL